MSTSQEFKGLGWKLTPQMAKEICQSYINGSNASQLARKYRFSTVWICKILAKAGIPRRKRTDYVRSVLTKENLQRLYWTDRKSITDIEKISGIKRETINKYLNLYEIPKRTLSEAALNKIETDPEYREYLLSKQRHRPEIHETALNEELVELRKQGFRCIPIGQMSYPKPDIIAIKDGKIFAVEVELSGIDYSKYQGVIDFDDIIWIRRKEGKRWLRK